MKASELRIGNHIYDLLGGVAVVRGLGTNSIWISDGPAAESLFNHIPITEEKLLEFGFQFRKCGQDVNNGKFSHWDYFIKGDFYLRSHNEKFVFCEFGRNGIIIEHIDQLQNLYFVLTGKELIKN